MAPQKCRKPTSSNTRTTTKWPRQREEPVAKQIFIQIPAYRDRELLPTLEALFSTAARPDELRVVLCWQFSNDEAWLAGEFKRWPQVQVIPVRAEDSAGVNWARHLMSQAHDGEPYILFLDSHHRFVPGWDELALSMHRELEEAGVEKPILTAYLPPYEPANDPAGRTSTVFRIGLNERREGLAFVLRGASVPNWQSLQAPVPAHFASLHFLLARSAFLHDVPVDPELYFFADEIAIALRAFTRGYDLFHPHRMVGWHLYDRSLRVTHWTDHPEWRQQNAASILRLAALYRGECRGEFGIGEARSVRDFEDRAGVRLIAAPDTA